MEDEKYLEFVEKFKTKKTTDDCYTPRNIHNAVLDWVREEYGLTNEPIVRPFYPGGDYEKFEYPQNCIVIDNPPFSIVTKIAKYYATRKIKFFIFAPVLTNFSTNDKKVSHVITNESITYENGAKVATAFLTNLEEFYIRSAPLLQKRIREENRKNEKKEKKEVPKYEYPENVLTATMVGTYSKYGVDFKVRKEECIFIKTLDSQKEKGKSIFGGGYLLSEKAAEKAAAEKKKSERWELSQREKEIIEKMKG